MSRWSSREREQPASVDQVMTETLRLSCADATPSLAWSVMTIDFRTRDDVDVETIDVADFFGTQLPRLAAERSALAVPGARELGVRPFTIETTAGTWTLSVDDDAVRVHPGGGWARRGAPRRGRDHRHRPRPPDADDAPRGRNARHAQR